MRIALIATCLADALFPGVAIATTRLLERLGHEVVFPAAQTCCMSTPDIWTKPYRWSATTSMSSMRPNST